METQQKTHLILKVILLSFVLVGFLSANSFTAEREGPDPNQSSKYLNAVREFTDNVLKYGRDTYGPKHTPLFVDGLMVRDPNYGKDGVFKPVEWIARNGERWVLCNLASQQQFFRTLVGLTNITGDPKYKQAAMDAIEYAFANLRSPNGLLYWGGHQAYDVAADKPCGREIHELKAFYPYYQLMWEVDPRATKQFIEAFWSAHILDWSNLNMNRHGSFGQSLENPWEHEYKGGPVFFGVRGYSFFTTGSDLIYAAASLAKLSGDEEPLVWGKRLAHRYVETRDSNTGIGANVYTGEQTKMPALQEMKDQGFNVFGPDAFFPHYPTYGNRDVRRCWYGYCTVSPGIPFNRSLSPWLSSLLVGDMIGSNGEEFIKWAVEELTALGKAAYRKSDNSWIPMIRDGTSLEGLVIKKGGPFGPEGTVVEPIPAIPMDFWAYALAYRLTESESMWQMARNIALGIGFGDIGSTNGDLARLTYKTECADPYALMGFLELYKNTKREVFLGYAKQIGDNILAKRFQRGFFVPDSKHVYTRFDSPEPIALLHLYAVAAYLRIELPTVWPTGAFFEETYRNKEPLDDISLIYTLTDYSEPPISLQEAASVGDVTLVRSLIEEGIDIDRREDSFFKTALHRAAMSGHIDVVELLLAHGADVNARDSSRSSSLHYAAQRGHVGIAKLLIDNGADINAKNNRDQTPLDIALSLNRKEIVALLQSQGVTISSIHVAAQLGNLARVKAFLKESTDINAKDNNGQTALHIAVSNNHKEIAELLIDQGADINSSNNSGQTPLHRAVRNNQIEVAELLIARGADVNLMPENGYSPLHYAVWNEDVNTVKLLLDHGAQFNTKDRIGWTAFYNAVWTGNRELVNLFVSKGADISTFHMTAAMGDIQGVNAFLEKGVDVDTKDEVECTPLFWATCMGQTEVIELLIAQGADVNLKTYNQYTALHQAARSDIAQLLISNGADVNAKNDSGMTPLHSACQRGNKEVVELLIDRGADINTQSNNGLTPLYLAVAMGRKDIVEFLIAKDADVNVSLDMRGRGARGSMTLLDFAERRGNPEIIELLHQGIDVNSVDEYGLTPLHIAAAEGDVNEVEFLIEQGASIDAKDNAGRIPLHYASGANEKDTLQEEEKIIDILLDNGANINAQDNIGWTPLHYSAFRRNNDIVNLLVDRGADFNIPNNRGDTPYSLVQVRISYWSKYRLSTTPELVSRPEFEQDFLGALSERINEFREISDLLHRENHIYFVSNNGIDTNPGTLENPLKTINAALDIVAPGDFIIVRGGNYSCSQTIHIDSLGEQGNPICLWAYPGEMPILDFSETRGDPVLITGAYWYLKGLTITKGKGGVIVSGTQTHHNFIEGIITFANTLSGITITNGAANNVILNCDSCRNFDPRKNGEDAQGFATGFYVGEGNVLIGNRSWNNSDDGYDCWRAGNSVRFEKCFSWRNGENIWNHPFFVGDGNGFKLGGGTGRHILIHCVAWNHHFAGFNLNGNKTGAILYGCTAVDDVMNYRFPPNVLGSQYSIFRNNISNAGRNQIDQRADSQFNSWDSGLALTITGDDFHSRDESVMSAPRNPDGSIPYNNFLKLAPGSAAIDAGIEVNMPYIGKAPDLGAFEYDSNENAENYVKMLHQYVRDHDIDKINEMLEAGTDINEKDWLGYSPLHWVCYFGYSDLVTLLIDKGADPNLVSDTGRTCLEIATAMDYQDLAELLRKHGAKE